MILAADDVRVKGEDKTVDRRKGLLDEVTRATGAVTAGEVSMGDMEGEAIDVGRPPGVRARLRVMPIPPPPPLLVPFKASREGAWTPVGVMLLLLLWSDDGDRTGRKLCMFPLGKVEVREGRRVEESVLRPVGVSSAVAYTLALNSAWARQPRRMSRDVPVHPARLVDH